MAFNVEAPGNLDHSIPSFGIFYLNIAQAAELVAKIPCFEGNLDVSVPEGIDDVSFDMPLINKILEKQIQSYASVIKTGVEKGTLKAAVISRELNDAVIPEETFIDVWELQHWLIERNIEIQGDWFEDYVEGEFRVSDAVGRAVALERNRIKEGWRPDENLNSEEKIASLESEILNLRSMAMDREPRKKAVKPLHTKERETLLKMIIGMAVDFYGYDPDASRSPISKEISDILAHKGIPLDPDTVRKWLKEASNLMPRNGDAFKS